MESLKLEGADLYYHKVGKGPVLICIPGANGTGDIFMPMAKYLADHFTVIAVDRRGYGNSQLTAPLPAEVANAKNNYRVKRDAKDIKAIAEHESKDAPVYILGSSSGAIVAMHVLKEYPEIVKKITFHEPPINTFLPNAQYWKDQNETIVQIENEKGMPEAMAYFGKTLNIAPIDAEMMSKPPEEDADISAQRITEMQNWFEYEMRQYTSSDIGIEDLKPYADKITLLNGEASKGSFPQEVNDYIAKQLNIRIIEIPGGHLGYVQDPEGFSHVLLKIWR